MIYQPNVLIFVVTLEVLALGCCRPGWMDLGSVIGGVVDSLVSASPAVGTVGSRATHNL